MTEFGLLDQPLIPDGQQEPQYDPMVLAAADGDYDERRLSPTQAPAPADTNSDDPMMALANEVLGPPGQGQQSDDPMMALANEVLDGHAPPPAPAAPPTNYLEQAKHKAYVAAQGLGGSYHGAIKAASVLEGAVPVILDKIHGLFSGRTETGLEDAWFKNMVEPIADEDSDFELGPDATFADKAVHGVASTIGMISQAILGGPEASEGEMTTALGRAAHGVKSMTTPAATSAVNTGQQVYQETGDAKKAVAAGTTSYVLNALMGAVPMAVGRGLPARVLTGAGIGAGVGEAQRRVQNAVLPEDMQAPFSAADTAVGAITGSLFGALPAHGKPADPLARAADTVKKAQADADQAQQQGSAAASQMTDAELDANPRFQQLLQSAQGMDPAAARQYARSTLINELGNQAALNATAKAVSEHATQAVGPAASAPAVTTADFGDLVGRARTAGVEPKFVQALSQALIHREIDPAQAVAQLQREMTRPGRATSAPVPAESSTTSTVTTTDPDTGRPAVADAAAQPITAADFSAAVRQAREARLPLDILRTVSRSVIRRQITPADGIEHLRAALEVERAQQPETGAVPEKSDSRFNVPESATTGTPVGEAGAASEAPGNEPAADEIPVANPKRGTSPGITSDRVVGTPEDAQSAAPVSGQMHASPGDGRIPQPTTTEPTFEEQLAQARAATNTQPTEAQKFAGNYAKGTLDFGGMKVALENPQGSLRTGRNANGVPWRRKMLHDYGYVKGAHSSDGDMVDVFLTGKPDTGKVFVVNQVDPKTGAFDEHKAVLGADSREEAEATYRANFPKTWKGIGSVDEMTTEQFREKAESGSFKKPGKAAALAASTSETQVPAPTLAPEGAQQDRTGEAIAHMLGRAAKRVALEGRGQEILDDLNERGVTSNEVARKFWSDTYFKLPAEAQAQFRRELESHAGYERGGMPDIDAGLKSMDLPNDIEHLEGTDRGFVALMDEANRRFGAQGAEEAAGSESTAGATEPQRLSAPEEAPAKGEGPEPLTAVSPEAAAGTERVRQQATLDRQGRMESAWQRLMRGDTETADSLAPEEARELLGRLDAAPGIHPTARAALSARAESAGAESNTGAKPLFSRRGAPAPEGDEEGHQFAAGVLRELGSVDQVFKNPASRSRTLQGALSDLAPDIRWGGEDTRPDEREESGADQRFVAHAESGEPVYVYQRGKEVWIDVSRLKRGQGGDAIYQAVADYARNSGRRFVGDPMGLSADAMARRTYHQLSNMLRYGDTQGFEPAPAQLEGAPERGIAPLDWPADNEGRLRALIKSFYETTRAQAPEIEHYRYDFTRKAFVDERTGAVVGANVFGRIALEGRGRAAPFGGRAVRAAVFLQSLVRSEGSRRPGILAQVLRQPSELVARGSFAPLFSRTEDPSLAAFGKAIGVTEALPFRRMAGRQWIRTLGKHPDVESSDLEQTGLKDWLGDRESVTKDELLEHLRTAAEQSQGSEAPESAPSTTAEEPAAEDAAETQEPVTTPEAAHTAEVRSWLDNAAQAVSGVADVHVVGNLDELREALGRDDIPEDVQGVYIAGGRSVWLVADQLGNRAEAESKLVHEVFGHLAMERYGDMDRAVRMVQQLHDLGSKTISNLWDEVARTQPALDPTTHAKEVIALMAERGVKNAVIDRLVTAARNLLRRMGVRLKYSDAELRQLIATAARALREDALRLPAVDDATAHQAEMAYRRGDDEELGTALGRMSIAEPALGSGEGPLHILAKAEIEPEDGPAVDEAVAHLLVGPPAPGAVEGTEQPQPLYARRAPEDPEITAIRRRVMANAQYEGLPLKDRLRLMLRRWTGLSALAVRQGMADSFASIAAYEKLLNAGKLRDASVSPYKQTVATQNLPSVMTAIMHTGVPVYHDGAYVRPTDGRKGLLEIFSPIVNHPDGNLLPQWELYAAAKRASRLIGETNPDGTSRERLFTQSEIDRSLQLAKQHPEFDQVFNDWQDFNRQTLDLAQEAGLIDPDSRTVWERNDYVPFYRAMEDAGGAVNPVALKRAISEQRARVLKLKGGAQPLEDVFESMLMNTAHLVDASFKNRAAQMIVKQFDGVATSPVSLDREAVEIDLPQVKRALGSAGINLSQELTPEQKAHWLTFFRGVKPAANNVISVRFDGKPQYFEVHDPLLYESIAGMNPDGVGRLLQLLGFTAVKRLVTRAATAMPSFLVRNFIRDTAEAWVQNHTGLTPFVSAAKGLATAVQDDWRGKDKIVHDLMLAGAGGDAVYDNQPGTIKKVLTRQLQHFDESRADALVKTVVSPRRAWEAYTKIQQASENANRIAVYKAARAQGLSHAEAAYQAHDLLNFQQHGAWAATRLAVGILPFLNARIQAFDRLLRSYKENRGAFLLKGSALVGLTAATMLLGAGNPQYEELEDWDRDAYWHFFVGGQHWRIPKPFELGALFGTLPERAIRLMLGEDRARDTGQSILRMLTDTFALNPIPPIAKPAIEDVTNHDFFTGRPIVPESLQGRIPEQQAQAYTSPTLVALSRNLPEWMPESMRSPVRLEHWIRGYTSALGMQAFTVADRLTRASGGYPDAPSKPWYESIPASLVTTSPPRDTKWVDELYRMQEESDAAAKAVTEYAREGEFDQARQLLQSSREKILLRPRLNQLAKAMRDLNVRARAVMQSKLPSDTKEEMLDRINTRRAEIARQVAPYANVF